LRQCKGSDAHHELIEHVAGLPSAVGDEDVAAKQFDLVVFRAELVLLHVDPAFNDLKTRITEIASLLEELPNVPMVAAEMELILEIQTDEFWQDVTLPMLETVRRRLRALVKLIEYKKRTLVYSDSEDSTGAAADIMVPGIPVGTDVDAFRRKARGRNATRWSESSPRRKPQSARCVLPLSRAMRHGANSPTCIASGRSNVRAPPSASRGSCCIEPVPQG